MHHMTVRRSKQKKWFASSKKEKKNNIQSDLNSSAVIFCTETLAEFESAAFHIMWKKVFGLEGVFIQLLFVWPPPPPPLQKISAPHGSESCSWSCRVGLTTTWHAVHFGPRHSKKRIGERNWKPPKNLWSRLTLWKQSSIAASCLMNRNYWHPFFYY